jgi:uncharacterized protein (UPF0548 family)
MCFSKKMPMLFQLFFPSTAQLDELIAQQKNAPLSYPRTHEKLKGYDYDDNCVYLGEGDAIFAAAKQAIQHWAMFEGNWARLYSSKTPIQTGEIVVMCAHLFGLWWLNASRIVYTVQELRTYGFAYGTLMHHVESGEELFQVEMDDAGKVWYRLRAFSKPRFWIVRLTYPLARVLQRRFVRDSLKNMQKMTHELHNRPFTRIPF